MALAPVMAYATGQEGDVMHVDGQTWSLLGRPVHQDSALYVALRDHLPDNKVVSTANYDGFVCYWSLDGDWLVLDSVTYEIVNEESDMFEEDYFLERSLPQEVMREVFKDYYIGNRIVATWVTDTLRVVQGEMLFYVHRGWNRHCEREMFIEVEKGHVANRELYNNRVVVDGFDIERCTPEQWSAFKNGFLPVLRKHFESDSTEKVYFEVGRCMVDSLGNLLDAELITQYKGKWEEFSNLFYELRWHKEDYTELELGRMQDSLDLLRREMRMDEFPELTQEFKRYLMSIKPWKVLYINGKYFTTLQHYGIPFSLKKEE